MISTSIPTDDDNASIRSRTIALATGRLQDLADVAAVHRRYGRWSGWPPSTAPTSRRNREHRHHLRQGEQSMSTQHISVTITGGEATRTTALIAAV
ncbi:hypothetical protein ACWGKU_29325 [Kitasatospora sp. NPDC054768]